MSVLNRRLVQHCVTLRHFYVTPCNIANQKSVTRATSKNINHLIDYMLLAMYYVMVERR